MLDILTKNITQAHGAKGREWLAGLESVVAKIGDDWSLKKLRAGFKYDVELCVLCAR